MENKYDYKAQLERLQQAKVRLEKVSDLLEDAFLYECNNTRTDDSDYAQLVTSACDLAISLDNQIDAVKAMVELSEL